VRDRFTCILVLCLYPFYFFLGTYREQIIEARFHSNTDANPLQHAIVNNTIVFLT
jgi:hypothetical protein